MTTVALYRSSKSDKAAYGLVVVIQDGLIVWVGRSIENLSKIFPAGSYTIVFEYSPRFGVNLWEIKGIPHRSECKFHAANFWEQLDGCVGVGLGHQDLDHDGDIDIVSSRKALEDFHAVMDGKAGDKATLVVWDLYS